jgi:hypothetical protein
MEIPSGLWEELTQRVVKIGSKRRGRLSILRKGTCAVKLPEIDPGKTVGGTGGESQGTVRHEAATRVQEELSP